jgi:hypothetical protein
MADYNFPRRFDLLLTQLGWLSTGCRLYKFASRTFYEAKSLAQPQDFLSLQQFIDLDLAELAAREEHYREAFTLAISGIRLVSLQRCAFGCHTISRMVIPPVSILARDRREGLSDGLRRGLQRSCRLRAQARLDLGPTGRERGEGGRRRRQVEGPHASRGTGGGHAGGLMGVAVIQAASLAGMPVRKPSLSQQGQQDGASGAPPATVMAATRPARLKAPRLVTWRPRVTGFVACARWPRGARA